MLILFKRTIVFLIKENFVNIMTDYQRELLGKILNVPLNH